MICEVSTPNFLRNSFINFLSSGVGRMLRLIACFAMHDTLVRVGMSCQELFYDYIRH